MLILNVENIGLTINLFSNYLLVNVKHDCRLKNNRGQNSNGQIIRVLVNRDYGGRGCIVGRSSSAGG